MPGTTTTHIIVSIAPFGVIGTLSARCHVPLTLIPGVGKKNASATDSLLATHSTMALDAMSPLPKVGAMSPDLTRTPPPASRLARSSVSGESTTTIEKVTMPQPGDSFFGFRLVEEIGHGTFARVFLARQESLAGRKVALKVTLRPTREPERIASLQHTNV